MLKELQEKIKLEVQRMQGALEQLAKALLQEENVFARMSDDLSIISLTVAKESKQERSIIQSEYGFTLSAGKEGKVSKLFSGSSNVLVLQGQKIIGSYISPVRIESELISSVFKLIERFKAEELAKQEKPAEEVKTEEAAPVTPEESAPLGPQPESVEPTPLG